MEREETSRRIASLRAQLGNAAHLDPVEELVPYVDGRLDRETTRAVEAHLANCEVCRREVFELRQFAQPRRRWRRTAAAFVGIAAAVVIAVTVLLNRRGPLRAVQQQRKPLVVSLRDGDRVIGIDEKGLLQGLNVDPETARQAASLLAHPDLVAPAAVAALAGNRRQLRGPVTHVAAIEVASPVGIAVLDTRPEFRWQSRVRGPYEITIVDGEAFELHGEAATERWTPPSALARGKTYSWEVATTTGRRVVAPSPPDSHARFRVVDEATAGAIRNANSHLIAGMLAYEAGAIADARREFALLASTNSSSPIPAKLVTSCDRAVGQ